MRLGGKFAYMYVRFVKSKNVNCVKVSLVKKGLGPGEKRRLSLLDGEEAALPSHACCCMHAAIAKQVS